MSEDAETWGRGDAGTKDNSTVSSSPRRRVSPSPRPLHQSLLTTHHSQVAAVILAAGCSRRMGAFKPLLPFGGKTVIESCVESLRAAGVEEIVVVLGHRADELRESLSHLPVSLALNEEAAGEMGVSIARGVERLSDEAAAVLIALADQPAISSEAIRSVIETYERARASFVVPRHGGAGGHPVLVDLKFRAELQRLGDGGLRALMREREAEVLRVEVDCPFVARDMDTWDDYVALHLEVFGVPPPVERPSERTGPCGASV